MQLFHLAFLGDIIRNVQYFLICLPDMVIQNNAKKTSQSEFQNTTHICISQMIWKSNYFDMKQTAKGSVHHFACVGQVGFFTWGCVVTQAVMNLLHVAFSQPPILF